jgi:aquaporin Z
MKNYLTEFIGTFFLVLTVCWTVVQNVPLAAVAIGCSLMVMVYMGGHVSGGHYNPAVSLAVLLRGKLNPVDFVAYVISQVLGALAAAYVVFAILGKSFTPGPGKNVSADQDFTAGAALTVEALYTFALALVVLNAATAKKTAGNSFYGLAIGFTVLTGAVAVGPISGAAFNPAVGTGPTVINALLAQTGTWQNLWIYWVGPSLGGAFAALVFKVQETES